MYSEFMNNLVDSMESSTNSQVFQDLLEQSMKCYLDAIAHQLNGHLSPQINRSESLIRASLLSSIIAQNPRIPRVQSLHYLAGMIFEQQGRLISRNNIFDQMNLPPEKNDYWYQETLSFLHYLSGGYRIQAIAILNFLKSIIRNN